MRPQGHKSINRNKKLYLELFWYFSFQLQDVGRNCLVKTDAINVAKGVQGLFGHSHGTNTSDPSKRTTKQRTTLRLRLSGWKSVRGGHTESPFLPLHPPRGRGH